MLPFKYRVNDAEGETLNVIARRHDLSVDDLRQWNPQLPRTANSEYYVVPAGSIVQLPPMLHYRGNVYGSSFRVGDFVERLGETMALQNELLKGLLPAAAAAVSSVGADAFPASSAKTSAPAGTPPLLFRPPARKILSKHELAQQATAAEGVRQMPTGPAMQQLARTLDSAAVSRSKSVANASFISNALTGVDLSPLAAALRGVEARHDACPREALQPHNKNLMGAVPARRKPNHLTDDRTQTTRDTSKGEHAVIDKSKDCQLSFAFYDTRTLYSVKEVWGVLASQPLGALIDALRCKTMLLAYHTTANSFLFIGGVFYIDDRHEGYRDLTAELRGWDPVRAVVERVAADGGGGANGAAHAGLEELLAVQRRGYGACPVRKVSETRFSDLTLRPNELCVFRHCGNCDHVFYLSDCGPVPASAHHGGDASAFASPQAAVKPLVHVHQYPRRLYLGPERTVNCDVCGKLPANIATYGDAIAPYNPALFCLPCFRISHCDRDGNEVNDGYVKLELPDGEFF